MAVVADTKTLALIGLFKSNLCLFDQQMLYCSMATGRTVKSWDDLSDTDFKTILGSLEVGVHV